MLLDGGAETIRRAAGALRRIPAGVKALWAVAGEHNYPVYVGDVLDGSFWPLRGRRFLLIGRVGRAAVRATGSRTRSARSSMPAG